MIHDGDQALVPSVTSTRLQPDRLKGEIQVVMHDDNILKVYSEIVRQFPDRESAQIHERLRLDEQNGTVGYLSLPDMGVKQVLIDGYILLQRQLVQDQKTCVVPVHPISDSRISQSCD
jgi:hypothetical protein